MTNTTGGSADSAPPPPAPAKLGAASTPVAGIAAVNRRSELAVRAISAVCLAPFVLWGMWLGGGPLLALLTLAAGLAMGEWAAMNLADGAMRRPYIVSTAGVAAALVVLCAASPWWALGALALGATLAAVAAPDRRLLAALGAPYVVIGCAALWTLAAGPGGRTALFYVVLAVWATDIGAYAAGRSIGGPKLAPRLSPKKTWAGLIGGMAAAALTGVGVALAAEGLAEGPILAAGLLAALLAVVAQAGDLFESWSKRRAGVKDSGRIIPGHGGLLDRIDGLLAAAPALALVQAASGPLFA